MWLAGVTQPVMIGYCPAVGAASAFLWSCWLQLCGSPPASLFCFVLFCFVLFCFVFKFEGAYVTFFGTLSSGCGNEFAPLAGTLNAWKLSFPRLPLTNNWLVQKHWSPSVFASSWIDFWSIIYTQLIHKVGLSWGFARDCTLLEFFTYSLFSPGSTFFLN